MGWGKLDDNLHDHPKVDDLAEVGPMGLWTLCLTWAHRHRRNRPDPSFVPWGTVERLGRRKARSYAKELLRVRLWEEADGGIRIHDFNDYAPGGSDEDRSEKAKKAARARWGDARPHAPEHAPEHPPSMPNGMLGDASRASAHGSDSDSDSDTNTKNTPQPSVGAPRAKRGTGFPEQWFLNPDLRTWAADKCPAVDVNLETEQWADHHRAKGDTAKDWTASWRTWMRNAQKWTRHPTQPATDGLSDNSRAHLALVAEVRAEQQQKEIS